MCVPPCRGSIGSAALLILLGPIANALTGKETVTMQAGTSMATILGGYRVDQGFGVDIGGRVDVKISVHPAHPVSKCEDLPVQNFDGQDGFGCSSVSAVSDQLCRNESWGTLYGLKHSTVDACCACGGGVNPGDLARTSLDVVLLTQEQMYIALRLQESEITVSCVRVRV